MVRLTAAIISVLLFSLPIAAQNKATDVDLNQQAVVETSEGTFVLSFYPDKAPQHVKLFLTLAAEGAYNGTLFHRVIKWGIIQGGDPLSRDPSKKALWSTGGMNKVPAEISDVKHVRGTLSSVIAPGKPSSGGNQFFLCVVPLPMLDGQYSAFGYVSEGLEVIDRISETPAEKELAVNPPVIRKVTLRPAQPPPPPAFSQTPPEELAKLHAVLETTIGNITLEFFPDRAPNHVRNFLRLARAGFYDGTSFHRVIPDFVAQGGLLSTRQPQLPSFRIADLVRRLKPEFNPTPHVKGTLSMARADEPDSAETSFFICLGAAPSLDNEYTVFGKVIEGLDVVEKFQTLTLDGESPKERVELKKVTVR
jgi:cyclophilin family peptidyl-prolyl cis-trans isomerase